MSPEQASARSWTAAPTCSRSASCSTRWRRGVLPFRGDTSAAIFNAILNREPLPAARVNPDLPDELDRIIRKCLEKDRDLRYQSARELMADLKRLRRDTSSGASAAHASGAATTGRPARGQRSPWPWVAAAVVVLTAALGAWSLARRRAAPAGPVTITPFTTDGGWKSDPRLSPDGERVAYSWNGPGVDSESIYVKPLGPGTRPLRLTEHEGDLADRSPVWSPDAKEIAFLRIDGHTAAIYTVPSLGGRERRLADARGPANFPRQLSWSPDGQSVVYPESASNDVQWRIVNLSLATLTISPVTSPPRESFGDVSPEISPDGRQVAFARTAARGVGIQDVWVQPLSGGDARRLTFGKYLFCSGLSWTPDGKEILFTGHSAEGTRLFRVSLAGGPPSPSPAWVWVHSPAGSAPAGWCTCRGTRRRRPSSGSPAARSPSGTGCRSRSSRPRERTGTPRILRTAGRSRSGPAAAASRTSG